MEKSGNASQTRYRWQSNRRMRFACRMTKATDTHSEYLTLLALHGKDRNVNVPQGFVYTYMACLV